MEFVEKKEFKPATELNGEFDDHGEMVSSIGFDWFLELEKQRHLRVSGCVCVLSFELMRNSNNHKHLNNGMYFHKFIESLAKLIKQNSRRIDLLFPVGTQVKLILTNATKEGACLAGKRIRSKLQKIMDQDSVLSAEDKSVEIQVDTWDYNGSVNFESLALKNISSHHVNSEDSTFRANSFERVNALEEIKLPNKWHFLNYKIKRCLDFMGALAGIIFFSPVLLLIAAAVKLNSRGPIFFVQDRIGLNGKKFKFIKFRSMYINTDDLTHRQYVTKLIKEQIIEPNYSPDKAEIFKLQNDPRITSIGKILRNLSLDELPQLFNVLKGEMSLVGPRPVIPYEVDKYDSWHFQRLQALPGITGLWQVNGRSRTTYIDMIRYDIKYIKNWSLWLDVKILVKTIRAVLSRDGAL